MARPDAAIVRPQLIRALRIQIAVATYGTPPVLENHRARRQHP
jgi:hypothetical protein